MIVLTCQEIQDLYKLLAYSRINYESTICEPYSGKSESFSGDTILIWRVEIGCHLLVINAIYTREANVSYIIETTEWYVEMMIHNAEKIEAKFFGDHATFIKDIIYSKMLLD